MLEKIIYVSNLLFNIVSTERRKENNYIKYFNIISHCLYDGVMGEIFIKIDNLLEIPVITID